MVTIAAILVVAYILPKLIGGAVREWETASDELRERYLHNVPISRYESELFAVWDQKKGLKKF